MISSKGLVPGAAPPRRLFALALALAPAGLVTGCGEDLEIDYIQWPLTAICSVDVTGKGTKDVENDYLPHVVTCENGAADIEALKAQAVAARTYLYYKAKSSGSICDGTSCQVYTCSTQPSAKHYAAVKATSGQVLVYNSVVICSFYVAGAKPSTSTCYPLSSDPDPTSTEKYVTYNEGKTGNAITQSSLGYVSPTNYYNRGCKSQNGANCLSKQGKAYSNILRFYYGDDIQLVTATGSCVSPSADGAQLDARPVDGGGGGKLDRRSGGREGGGFATDGLPYDGYYGEAGPSVARPPSYQGTQGCGCTLATTAEDPSVTSLLLLILPAALLLVLSPGPFRARQFPRGVGGCARRDEAPGRGNPP